MIVYYKCNYVEVNILTRRYISERDNQYDIMSNGMYCDALSASSTLNINLSFLSFSLLSLSLSLSLSSLSNVIKYRYNNL